ncbi:MAG: hypothetical protein H7255_15885 [Ramlibacter sp.]|nr:hypothetical protein [Ramlibacter sp.]
MLWSFVNRFAQFRPFEAIVKTDVDGELENWPVAAGVIRRLAGVEWAPSFSGCATNFEEASLAMMPREVYERYVLGYTEKQWGEPASMLSASMLSASLARRFEVRGDDDPRLSRHRHQGLPEAGYAAFTTELLRGIPLIANCDWLRHRWDFKAERGAGLHRPDRRILRLRSRAPCVARPAARASMDRRCRFRAALRASEQSRPGQRRPHPHDRVEAPHAIAGSRADRWLIADARVPDHAARARWLRISVS